MASLVSVDVDVVPERHIHSPEERFDPARPFAWGPEALIVLRGFHVVNASERAIESIARDLTGSDIRTAIPGWPEDPTRRLRSTPSCGWTMRISRSRSEHGPCRTAW